jgi:hypothetical protein
MNVPTSICVIDGQGGGIGAAKRRRKKEDRGRRPMRIGAAERRGNNDADG